MPYFDPKKMDGKLKKWMLPLTLPPPTSRYGYAKAPKAVTHQWGQAVTDYVSRCDIAREMT